MDGKTKHPVPKTLIIDSTSTGIWGEKFTAVWPSVQWEISPIVTIGKNTDKMKVYNKNYWDSVFTRQVITLPFFISSGNPTATNVYLPFNPPHHFYINVDGQRIREISEIGSLIATDTIVPVNSNSIKSFFNYTICCDNPFYISYQYGGGKENAVIVRSISVQYSDYYAETPTLGTNPNPFNRGDVAIGFSISGLYNPVRVFVLSANNGIGCYLTDLYLPVELENFSFYIDRNDVILNWKTATETNNYGFEIQRKKGDEYDYIGFVNGVGTTTQAHEYSFIDKELLPGKYKYRLKQIDFDGSVNFSKEIEVNTELSIEFKLHQNYPNPVNPTTTIKFSIPSANSPILGGAKSLFASGGGGLVTLKVYDALGSEVTTLVNEVKSPGNYEVTFKANALASGIYYYRLKAGDFTETKKMILLR